MAASAAAGKGAISARVRQTAETVDLFMRSWSLMPAVVRAESAIA